MTTKINKPDLQVLIMTAVQHEGFTQFWSNHVNLLLGDVARCFVNGAGNFDAL